MVTSVTPSHLHPHCNSQSNHSLSSSSPPLLPSFSPSSMADGGRKDDDDRDDDDDKVSSRPRPSQDPAPLLQDVEDGNFKNGLFYDERATDEKVSKCVCVAFSTRRLLGNHTMHHTAYSGRTCVSMMQTAVAARRRRKYRIPTVLLPYLPYRSET